MPQRVANGEQPYSLQRLEEVAHLLSQARHPAMALERTLQVLGETLQARGGAVVLAETVPKRLSSCGWGEYQRQIVQLGKELVDGMEAHSTATARHTMLPGVGGAQASSGVLLAAPLRALQQALGVIVFFCSEHLIPSAETALAFVNLAATHLGFYLQTFELQERFKTRSEFGAASSASPVGSYDPDRIVGQSPLLRAIMQEIEQVARSRSTVLLRGESGTGKELVARALHKYSERHAQPFVKLNCAALPESLLESELFGHERGAFTGAVKTRRGRFEMAHQGTIFLDEIGDISVSTQVKLLRVLQERTFERVGGNRPIHVDVRIIAATNANLEEAVRGRHFREDLYYRLHVVPVVLPPLRQRKEDIPLLVGHFLQRFNAENRKTLKISSAAMELIVEYDWPGNVRELENCVERMVVMARRDVIAPEDVPLPGGGLYTPRPTPALVLPPEPGPLALPKAVADIERERLLEALRRSGGVQTRAATLLGITPRQLGYKLKKYHIAARGVVS